MQDAKTETKDYSVQKTKGGRGRRLDGVEVGARRAPSIVALYRWHPARPPLRRSLTRGQDCGVVALVICSRQKHDTSLARLAPGERSLCFLCLDRPCDGGALEVPSYQYLISLHPCHEASRGPMVTVHALLIHAERMDAASLPEHFSSIISFQEVREISPPRLPSH